MTRRALLLAATALAALSRHVPFGGLVRRRAGHRGFIEDLAPPPLGARTSPVTPGGADHASSAFGSELEQLVERTDDIRHAIREREFNVRHYGATGDGETDDTPAIQATLNAVPSGVFGGGSVFLPPGSYRLSSSIAVPSGVTLYGASPQQTRLAPDAGVTAITVPGRQRVRVENLMIDGGARASTVGIELQPTSTQVTLRNLWLESLAKGVRTRDSYFVHLEQVRVVGFKQHAFELLAASNSITLLNCSTISRGGGHALEWQRSAALSLLGCTFEGDGKLHAYTVEGLLVHGCYFESDFPPARDSVWLSLGDGNGGAAKAVSIRGNLFNHGREFGVLIASAAGVEVAANRFRNPRGAVRLYHFDRSPKQGVRVGVNDYDFQGAGHDPSRIMTDWGTPSATSLAARESVVFQAPAPPDSGTWSVADRVENVSPMPGGYLGWVCTKAGTPGVWKGYGRIEE